MITKEKYDELKAQSEMASKNNDYSKMIMMGSIEAKQMKVFEQNNRCTHPSIGTDGGGDYCKQCGKRWDR